MHRLGLTLLGLFLGTFAGVAQERPESASITFQGKGPCITRSFPVQDNWHAESTSDSAIKVEAQPIDGSPPTTVTDSPTPANGLVSTPVTKGGTYRLAITSTGSWQVTMIENSFTKNLALGGAQPAAPAASASPAISPTGTLTLGAVPGMGPKREVTTLHGLGTQPPSQPFTVQSDWDLLWTTNGAAKITLIPTNGGAPIVIANVNPPSGSLPDGTQISLHGSSHQATPGTYTVVVEGSAAWMVRIMEATDGTSTASTGTTPTAPNVGTAPAPTASAAPVKLTSDQARAVVLIKGDISEGTGFLVKMPDGPVVVTNIHVIANNPNIKITTNTGAVIPMISARGAADRDLALLSIKDDGYSYLTLCPDISKIAQTGDEVVTPGNSLGGEVMLNTDGKVLGIGPEKIEIDNPIYHGNSGGPIFHTKSGQVVGVVTEGIKVNTGDALDKNSFTNRNSAISGTIRYFGMRLDNVPSWVPIDWDRFQNETLFLAQFHDQSRRLDAFLNVPDAERSQYAYIYIKDEKIMKANDTFHQSVGVGGRGAALKELVFDLEGIVDKDMDQIQNPNNFYSFDQERAQHETEYRKALKKELDTINDNADRLQAQSK